MKAEPCCTRSSVLVFMLLNCLFITPGLDAQSHQHDSVAGDRSMSDMHDMRDKPAMPNTADRPGHIESENAHADDAVDRGDVCVLMIRLW